MTFYNVQMDYKSLGLMSTYFNKSTKDTLMVLLGKHHFKFIVEVIGWNFQEFKILNLQPTTRIQT